MKDLCLRLLRRSAAYIETKPRALNITIIQQACSNKGLIPIFVARVAHHECNHCKSAFGAPHVRVEVFNFLESHFIAQTPA